MSVTEQMSASSVSQLISLFGKGNNKPSCLLVRKRMKGGVYAHTCLSASVYACVGAHVCLHVYACKGLAQ